MTDTITLPRSVVEQALEALNRAIPDPRHIPPRLDAAQFHTQAVTALRAALEAKVVDEPVAWQNTFNGFICKERSAEYQAPLYLHPAPANEDVKDAARYRWLRQQADVWCFNSFKKRDGIEFDAAIDAAMKKENSDE